MNIIINRKQEAKKIFSEELGAVIQVRQSDLEAVTAVLRMHRLDKLTTRIGALNQQHVIRITQGGATVADTSTGTGLIGGTAVNLLTLFGAGNTATFTFTTGSGINTSMPLVFTFLSAATSRSSGASATITC